MRVCCKPCTWLAGSPSLSALPSFSAPPHLWNPQQPSFTRPPSPLSSSSSPSPPAQLQQAYPLCRSRSLDVKYLVLGLRPPSSFLFVFCSQSSGRPSLPVALTPSSTFLPPSACKTHSAASNNDGKYVCLGRRIVVGLAPDGQGRPVPSAADARNG